MSKKFYSFLGITVNPLTMENLHDVICESINNKKKYIISNHNLHSLYIFHKDCKMRKFYSKSDYVHIDGMALIFLGRLFGYELLRDHRVTYVDWVRPLMQEARDKGWKILFLGSKPGVGDKAAKFLQDEFPGLELRTHHGYFDITKDSNENKKVIDFINSYKPNILMVGMGMPRQEKWILENYSELSTNAILTAGACMDYVAGEVPTPPRWLGRIGLEWLYRLLNEPKRLGRRYLLEPWYILKLVILELLKIKLNRLG